MFDHPQVSPPASQAYNFPAMAERDSHFSWDGLHSQLRDSFPQFATCLPTSSACRKKPFSLGAADVVRPLNDIAAAILTHVSRA